MAISQDRNFTPLSGIVGHSNPQDWKGIFGSIGQPHQQSAAAAAAQLQYQQARAQARAMGAQARYNVDKEMLKALEREPMTETERYFKEAEEMAASRWAMGQDKYGKDTYLKRDTIRDIKEEITDGINYLKSLFVKVSMLEKSIKQMDGGPAYMVVGVAAETVNAGDVVQLLPQGMVGPCTVKGDNVDEIRNYCSDRPIEQVCESVELPLNACAPCNAEPFVSGLLPESNKRR
jgi:hypothetical protein